jgi:hypothetical protein
MKGENSLAKVYTQKNITYAGNTLLYHVYLLRVH